MARKRYHVTPHKDGGWQVKRRRAERADSIHRLKSEAVGRGRELAGSQSEGQLFIHGRDGKIQTEHTYGNDPYPPAG